MAGKLGSYEAVRSKDLSYSRVELSRNHREEQVDCKNKIIGVFVCAADGRRHTQTGQDRLHAGPVLARIGASSS
jgi:hypothetical protein